MTARNRHYGKSSFWQKPFDLLRVLLRELISLFLKPDVIGDAAISGLEEETYCYVMQIRSKAELALLEKACLKLNLRSPREVCRITSKVSAAHSYAVLKQPRFRLPWGKRPSLSRFQDGLKEDPASDLILVPVAMYWGRAPHNEKSIWRLFFTRHWKPPGFVQRIYSMIFNRQHITLHYGKPLSIREAVGEAIGNDHGKRRIERLMKLHFHRQRLAILGPDVSHRRTLIKELVETKLKQTLAAKGGEMDKQSVAKTKKKIKQYAFEIAAHKSYTAIRLLDYVMHWFWNKAYDGVYAHGAEKARAASESHTLIYLPCHRSYIDSVLLPYSIWHAGLDAPHFASGINLNLPLIGPIIRRCGGFFIRRSGGSALYWEVLQRYIRLIIKGGFSIALFTEGKRTRTGLMLEPMLGLLSMILTSHTGIKKPIAFVPIFIGYETIMEGNSYIRELKGRKKRKETLGRFMSILREKISLRNYGRVHINFGDPIYLNKFLKENNIDIKKNFELRKPKEIEDITRNVATFITKSINKSVIFMEINLISCCLSSSENHSIRREDMHQKIDLLIQLTQAVKISNNFIYPETDPEKIIARGVALGVLYPQPDSEENLLSFSDEFVALSDWYKNNILHTLIVPSIVCLIWNSLKKIEPNEVSDFFKLIYPYLSGEYFLPWEEEELDLTLEKSTNILEKIGVLEKLNDRTVLKNNKDALEKIEFISYFSKAIFDRYSFVINTLHKQKDNEIKFHKIKSILSKLNNLDTKQKHQISIENKIMDNFVKKMAELNFITSSDTGHLMKQEGFFELQSYFKRIRIDSTPKTIDA